MPILTAIDLMSRWRSYPVKWTALTTNPSIGNGILEGRYVRIGKTILVYVRMHPSTTTTFGSGEWRFSCPFEAKRVGYTGAVYALDAGTAHHVGGARITDIVVGPDGTTAGVYQSGATGGGAYSATVPFAWAAIADGDALLLSLMYEAAK